MTATTWHIGPGRTWEGKNGTKIAGKRTIRGKQYGKVVTVPSVKLQESRIAGIKKLIDGDLDAFEQQAQ